MLARLRSLFGTLRHRARFEDHMREEMRFHIDAYAGDLERGGMSRHEALRRARMEFGTPDAIKDDCRQARGLRLFDEVSQDVRYALRIMAKAPGFTAAAVLSLALGIGANTAIFTLIDALLLRTIPVSSPQELYFLAHGRGTNVSWMSTYPLMERYVSAPVFTGIAAYDGPQPFKVSEPTGVHLVSGQFATRNYHALLGVQFLIGRGFIPGPDRTDENTFTAVISYGYWQRRFGGDREVLGKTITVNRRVVSIVGVTAPAFSGLTPGTHIDITLPLSFKVLDSEGFYDRHDTWTSMPIVGRLKPGIGVDEARAGVDVLFQQHMAQPENQWIRKRAPESYSVAELMPADKGSSSLRRQYSQALWILMGMVGVVLLIASANVANLLLARSAARAKEVAIRLCVGGARWRIVRQFLTESAILAFAGGTLGVLLAMWGTGAILSLFGGESPIVLSLSPNARVLGFTLAVSMVTGIAFGMLPALKATAINLTPALKESADRGAARSGWSTGKALVAMQVALCAVVVTVAALFVQTLHNIKRQPTGFERSRVLLFALDNLGNGFEKKDVPDFASGVISRLREVPGVVSAAASTSTPVHTGGNARVLQIPGTPPPVEDRHAWTNVITPGYFETLGISLVRGRLFTEQDGAGAPSVGILNEAFAREYFGNVDPVGRHVGLGAEPKHLTEIIGIVRDAHQTSLREPPPRMIYTPIAQSDEPPSRFTVSVQTAREPAALAATVRDTVQSIDKDLVIRYLRTMEQQIDNSLVRERVLATLSTGFGLLALILAVVGIYGVMAYDVTRRAREIGIRMALGAGRGAVLRQILRQCLIVATIGVAIGMTGASIATRTLSTFLFDLSARDPATFAGVALLLLVTTIAAGFVPARRAATLDPVRAIRTE
jgi:macrolide transport system ATP-binding/permease protein